MKPEPIYYKWHRVFSNKKHCNGTVLQHRWSDNAQDWIYEITLDNGQRIWATKWTISSESPIEWYIGSRGYLSRENQDCRVIEIKGFNSTIGDWLVVVELSDGQKVTTPQREIKHRRQSNEDANI
ncbi:hypothetical protein QPK87_25280 [Kamptonema cortianum]|nr:hypothetical protein [Desertifilum sp.]MDK3159848.1 hypothetical protein [Kamptonema cortianum]